MRLWACLLELWQIRYGREYKRLRKKVGHWFLGTWWIMADIWQTRFGREKRTRRPWQGYLAYQVEVWQTRFGRRWFRREVNRFTWLTYYVAVTRSLKTARACKTKWGRGYISVETCLMSYARFEGVRQRAHDQGYVKMAKVSINDSNW